MPGRGVSPLTARCSRLRVQRARCTGGGAQRRLAACSAAERGDLSASATHSAAAASLDAAASTVQQLKASLPFVTNAALVGEDVSFSFVDGLVTLKGRDAYVAHQRHCAEQVAQELSSWKFRIESAFQADARTLQVRWVSTWDAAPGMGWDGLAREAALEDKRLSAETRVSQLTRELESARSELLAAQRLLEGRGSVLSPALGALDRGLEQSRELGVAVGEAREAAPTEWGLLRMVLAGDDGAPGTGSLAALEKLRWSLTSRVRGTTLLKLDDAGRVVLHEDRLDLSRQPGGPAAGSSSGDDEEPSYVAGSQSDLFAWCCAHRPASSNRLGYVFGVVSTLLWLSFRTEEGVDDEARVALADRREFDTLLAGVLASLVFLTGLAAVGTVSWLAFAAPHLPAQVQAFVGEPGTQATLNALKSLDVGRLLRGRSLFDAGEFGGPLD